MSNFTDKMHQIRFLASVCLFVSLSVCLSLSWWSWTLSEPSASRSHFRRFPVLGVRRIRRVGIDAFKQHLVYTQIMKTHEWSIRPIANTHKHSLGHGLDSPSSDWYWKLQTAHAYVCVYVCVQYCICIDRHLTQSGYSSLQPSWMYLYTTAPMVTLTHHCKVAAWIGTSKLHPSHKGWSSSRTQFLKIPLLR